jgi:hypothetical protein
LPIFGDKIFRVCEIIIENGLILLEESSVDEYFFFVIEGVESGIVLPFEDNLIEDVGDVVILLGEGELDFGEDGEDVFEVVVAFEGGEVEEVVFEVSEADHTRNF